MESKMTLGDSECSFISQALALAADTYVGFATDAMKCVGGVRLQQQFLHQAEEARRFAIIFEDGWETQISIGERCLESIRREADQLTKQNLADTINARLTASRERMGA